MAPEGSRRVAVTTISAAGGASVSGVAAISEVCARAGDAMLASRAMASADVVQPKWDFGNRITGIAF
ncbi:hypothetical protein JMG10_17770 [Nostoc ellipsosporum NOK]|nr:hypothetical protein [Nostoc ellipsosporum NOK]